MPEHEDEFYISLGPDKALRIRAALISEGLPTPGEADAVRPPCFSEMLSILDPKALPRISTTKPF